MSGGINGEELRRAADGEGRHGGSMPIWGRCGGCREEGESMLWRLCREERARKGKRCGEQGRRSVEAMWGAAVLVPRVAAAATARKGRRSGCRRNFFFASAGVRLRALPCRWLLGQNGWAWAADGYQGGQWPAGILNDV